MKLLIKIIILSQLFICCSKVTNKNENKPTVNDSISYWINSSENKKYSKSEQLLLLDKAFKKNSLKKNDSSKSKNLSIIAYRYFELRDSVNFFIINNKAQALAYKIKDTFVIADTHWSLGEYYSKKDIYTKAYFHLNEALTNFNKIGKTRESGMILRDLSIIRKEFRDYFGTEVLLFQAIKKFRTLKDYRQLFHCYSALGGLSNQIKEFEKSLKYYRIAIEYLEKSNVKKYYYSQTLNNIGFVLLNKGDFIKSIQYFDKALKNTNSLERIARIISNKSDAKLRLKDTFQVKINFLKALKIRDSIGDKVDIIDSKICLSNYYNYVNDSISSYNLAKEANDLANEINNGFYYLKTLNLLSKYDKKNSSKYLEKYIKYNDSLITVERKTQNKFTRIEFETDEIKEESERLSQQRIWILTSSIGLILILSLIYLLKVQKSRNERLLLEAEQQEANEQVYVLTLKQQAILEEEKVQERNRISQELHDGVLGRLFGTRVGLGFLDISDDESTQEQHQTFLNELQDIEKEIRDVSHKLSNDFNSSEVNFKSIIEQLFKEKSVIGKFKYELNIDKNITWKNVNEIVKVNVYRIIQESLQNIIKHANASNVILKFSQENDQLKIAIEDDGVGFNTSKSKKGIGLKNIKSRIKKINGTLDIVSEKNKGTILQINIRPT